MIWLLMFGCVPDRPLVPVELTLRPLDETLPTLEDGRTLELTEARIVLASLALYEPESELALTWPLGATVAHAHPGHEADGDNVAALALNDLEVDLLGDDLPIEGLQIYAGAVGTASIMLTGEAHFAGTLGDTAVDLTLPVEHVVSGIPASFDVDEATPPSLVLATSSSRLLTWTPFDTDPGADGVLTTDDSESLTNGLRFGVLSTTAWTLETP